MLPLAWYRIRARKLGVTRRSAACGLPPRPSTAPTAPTAPHLRLGALYAPVLPPPLNKEAMDEQGATEMSRLRRAVRPLPGAVHLRASLHTCLEQAHAPE